jgi:hypothetical protein
MHHTMDFDDNDIGLLVTLKDTGARANDNQLRQYLAALGPHYRDDGSLHYIRDNLRTGLTIEDQMIRAPAAQMGLALAAHGWVANLASDSGGALREETDPLDTALSRIFVGLTPA